MIPGSFLTPVCKVMYTIQCPDIRDISGLCRIITLQRLQQPCPDFSKSPLSSKDLFAKTASAYTQYSKLNLNMVITPDVPQLTRTSLPSPQVAPGNEGDTRMHLPLRPPGFGLRISQYGVIVAPGAVGCVGQIEPPDRCHGRCPQHILGKVGVVHHGTLGVAHGGFGGAGHAVPLG